MRPNWFPLFAVESRSTRNSLPDPQPRDAPLRSILMLLLSLSFTGGCACSLPQTDKSQAWRFLKRFIPSHDDQRNRCTTIRFNDVHI
jgi:hypothetical protein